MIKLRTILLYDFIYYLIFIIAIVYTIFSIYTVSNNIKKDTQIEVVVTNIEYKNNKTYITGNNILAYYKGNIKMNLGDKLILNGNFVQITANTNFNLFNYKNYLLSIGVDSMFEIHSYKKVSSNINLFFFLKQSIINKINKYDKIGPYLHAFILGNTDYIDEVVLENYRKNGISHLFAVSGMHISFIAIFLLALLKKLKIEEDNRYYITILFLIFYMFLCGFTKSVMRSSFLFILLSINKIFYFHIKSINILLIVISILLFLNPFNIYNIGFLYSSIISFFLILSVKVLENKSKIKTAVYVSLISFFAGLPISFLNFFSINFFSIIINLFMVPIVSIVIFPLTVLSFFLPFISSTTYFIIEIFNNISAFLSNIKICTLIFFKPNLILILLYYFLLILIILKQKWQLKLLYILILVFHYNNFFISSNYMIMLDVGQGNSVLIVKDNTVFLYDVKGGYKKDVTAKNTIIPVIKSLGIKKIHHLILSHGDADHIKDAYYLINNFKVDNIYLNTGTLNEFETKIYEYAKNNYINISRKITKNTGILFLNTKDYSDENDNSIVLYTIINGHKILLMGDVSIPVSHEIMNKYNIKNVDVLLLSHHGSKYSSDVEFIKYTNPKIALISVGYNTFNHPSNEVINILEENNITYFRADTDRSIKLKFTDNINIEFIR